MEDIYIYIDRDGIRRIEEESRRENRRECVCVLGFHHQMKETKKHNVDFVFWRGVKIDIA